MKTIVIYKTKYGSTRTYAKWIAEELGCCAKDVKDVTADDLKDYDAIVYGGGLYAEVINGVSFITKNFEALKEKKIAVFTTGITPIDVREYYDKLVIEKNFKPYMLDVIKVFNFPGKMITEELSMVHRASLKTLKKIMSAKKHPTAMEKLLVKLCDANADFTDKSTIVDLTDYIKGTVRSYIFDMDGTLINSMPFFAKAMFEFLCDNDISYPSDVIKIITPLGLAGTAQYYQSLGCDMSVEEITDDFVRRMIKSYETIIPAKKGVKETLERLKAEGHSLNVLTASPHSTLDPCLKRLELYDIFDNVWSSDDFDYKKTDVEIYSECAKRLGASIGNCVFLDDNYNALKTAKEAGMHVVGVYDESSEDYAEEIKSLCYKYIRSFTEL